MTIDKKLINELYDKAVVNPRLRINYDLRNSELDLSQRMLNAMMPGTKVDIHRHPNSSESVIIICGSIDEVYYDEKGNDLSSKKNEWEEIVVSKTGLTFDKFSKAVMLSQGKFSEFLSMDGKNKAAMLGDITGTGIYSEISKKVYERANKESVVLSNLNTRLSDIHLFS